MVVNLSDIKHLEVMASIQDKLPEDNSNKEDKIIDYVFAKDNNSIANSITTLCSNLRSKGFNKYADNLEQKFLTYAANVHLYRAHDEDGEDIINAAHPDGDPNMGDGEHGDVETILSKHKKIVDVVNKQPTGKLAKYVSQCKIVLGQEKSGITYKNLVDGMKDNYNKLLKIKSFISSLQKQPEVSLIKTQLDEIYDATNSVFLYMIDLFKLAQDISKRGTELNPSKSLITTNDINSLINDPRYKDFANILTVSDNPAEIFTKFSQIINFIRTKLFKTINAITDAEIKKNILDLLNKSGF